MAKQSLYTIGYTSFVHNSEVDIERMMLTLRQLQVNYLVDVRSSPYSGQFPQTNCDILKGAGKAFGIPYVHMGELGAQAKVEQAIFSRASEIFFEQDAFPISKSNRPEHTELQPSEEIVDFNKFRHDDYFVSGLKRIEVAYQKGFTLCLMCSEKQPMNCHRYFLISRALNNKFGEWLEIKHIAIKDGQIVLLSQSDLDKQLEDTVCQKRHLTKETLLTPSLLGGSLLDNYHGDSLQAKLDDYCDRYWNLMHGWKKGSVNDND